MCTTMRGDITVCWSCIPPSTISRTYSLSIKKHKKHTTSRSLAFLSPLFLLPKLIKKKSTMAVETEASTPLQRMVSTPQSIPHSHSNTSTKDRSGISLDVPTCSTEIDLTVLKGPALETAVTKLLRTLFPGLVSPHQKIAMERVSGALTNAIYFVTVGKSKLLLRVYGVGCDEFIDRTNELRWLARLSRLKLCPRLLAIFGNGRFEEYLPSTTLTASDIHDPMISQQLALRFRQLHSLVHVYPLAISSNTTISTSLSVWQCVDRYFHALQQSAAQMPEQVNMAALGHEITMAKSILTAVDSPIVFAHNDAQYGNVLRLTGSNDLVMVDFEYSGYNPRGYDFANHFCEWMYDYHSETPESMDPSMFPSIDEQRRFLTAYVTATGADNNNKQQMMMKKVGDVDALLQETSAWLMGCHLHWALWGFVQATRSEIDFDYWSYSLQRLQAFRKELAFYK
ncbi:kinase-like domain-containing protein [Zychaea mexicana]|uniref:kinase-like domain-containing protein n=1 Tax=Zychaea mexicana TaxID=64656 RepID=UPI0022FF2140|nr:kinase-like domain-containing protein [Zychaea mexicana]KAI9496708.1 kinase-like domain-containing protein [Zychaea mexicana]